jgi:hypothetical protein
VQILLNHESQRLLPLIIIVSITGNDFADGHVFQQHSYETLHAAALAAVTGLGYAFLAAALLNGI